jgi:hypothetical protein
LPPTNDSPPLNGLMGAVLPTDTVMISPQAVGSQASPCLKFRGGSRRTLIVWPSALKVRVRRVRA